ncbi:MAG: type II toxin-antitoxin system RelE/ParE family toxin [Ignavibacteria bacterium]
MVNWSITAKNGLKAIYSYIKKDSNVYANKVIEDIITNSELLDKFPKMGRMVPEISEINVREIFVYSYRIIYEITGKDIFCFNSNTFFKEFRILIFTTQNIVLPQLLV